MSDKKSSKDRREKLRNKMRNDAKNKDSGGGGKRLLDISDYPDISFFKPKVGTNNIAILPFILGTNLFAKVKDNSAKGDEDYILDIWAHTFIGPGQDSFVCLAKTFGKPCPICEEIQSMQKDGSISKETLDQIKAKRKSFFNVVDLDDEEKGIQIFDVAHFLFTKELLEEAETGDEFVMFADLDEGKNIKFRAANDNFKGRKTLRYKNFSFVDRDPIDEAVLEDTFPLDKMLRVCTYEEIRDAYYGAGDDPDSDEEDHDDPAPETEAPAKSGKMSFLALRTGRESAKKEEPEEEEDDQEDTEEDTPKKSSPMRSRKPAAPAKKQEEPEDEEEEPEDEEEQEPVKPKKSAPPAASGKKESSSKCPSGYKFGADCDEYKECASCDLWEACAEENDKGK